MATQQEMCCFNDERIFFKLKQMKKTVLFMLVAATFCSVQFTQAAIVYTNPTDQVLASGGTISVDFNNDGTAEFDFQDVGFGSVPEVGVMFASANHHLTTVSTAEWDVMKSIAFGTVINASVGFFDQGDAYINPAWGTTQFSIGDSYLGAKFTIGASTYYGWILVNLTGNGVFTIKSFAYENTANTAISAGATSTASIQEATISSFNIVPNPANSTFDLHRKADEPASVVIYSMIGEIAQTEIISNAVTAVSIVDLPLGMYIVRVTCGAQMEEQLLIKTAN